MKQLKFTQNWNNKLNTENFTTIRIAQDKYYIDCQFDIILQDQYLKTVKIIDIKQFKIDKLNDFTAYIDSGMNRTNLYQLLAQFYPKQNINKMDWYLILLQTIIPAPSRQIEILQEFKLHSNSNLIL
jgi:hypothetical protein